MPVRGPVSPVTPRGGAGGARVRRFGGAGLGPRARRPSRRELRRGAVPGSLQPHPSAVSESSDDINWIAVAIIADPNRIHRATQASAPPLRNQRPNADTNNAVPMFATTAEAAFSFSFSRRRSVAVRSISLHAYRKLSIASTWFSTN